MIDFNETPPGHVRLEYVTEAQIAIAPKQKVVILDLETKPFDGSPAKTRFQCAMTDEQAISIGKLLEGAAQEISSRKP